MDTIGGTLCWGWGAPSGEATCTDSSDRVGVFAPAAADRRPAAGLIAASAVHQAGAVMDVVISRRRIRPGRRFTLTTDTVVYALFQGGLSGALTRLRDTSVLRFKREK